MLTMLRADAYRRHTENQVPAGDGQPYCLPAGPGGAGVPSALTAMANRSRICGCAQATARIARTARTASRARAPEPRSLHPAAMCGEDGVGQVTGGSVATSPHGATVQASGWRARISAVAGARRIVRSSSRPWPWASAACSTGSRDPPTPGTVSNGQPPTRDHQATAASRSPPPQWRSAQNWP